MTQVSASADYSTLKEKLLQMWLPVVGVRKFIDALKNNFAKLCHHHFTLQMDQMEEDFMMEVLKVFFTEVANKIISIESSYHKDLSKIDVGYWRFDTDPSLQFGETILTGSYSEGLFLYFGGPPDIDFMCVLKNITFTQEDQENGSLSFREHTPFVNAFIKNEETRKLWNDFLDDEHKNEEKNQLSSRKLKEKLQEIYEKSGGNDLSTALRKEYWQLEDVAEGAAVTIKRTKFESSLFDASLDFFEKMVYGFANDNPLSQEEIIRSAINFCDMMFTCTSVSSDIVLCIFCEGWPSCAQEWYTRERFWPDVNLVENITQGRFHIVPKSSPDGNFRLSFSRAEIMLIKALTPLQHRVMRSFKAVVKYHQDSWSPSVKSTLSSYHLKTIAFWYFEKTSQESWSEETVVLHLVALLEELAEALRRQHLPIYFMPKVNLLQDVDHELSFHVMEKILKLSHNFSALFEALEKHSTLCETLIFTSLFQTKRTDFSFDVMLERILKILIKQNSM